MPMHSLRFCFGPTVPAIGRPHPPHAPHAPNMGLDLLPAAGACSPQRYERESLPFARFVVRTVNGRRRTTMDFRRSSRWTGLVVVLAIGVASTAFAQAPPAGAQGRGAGAAGAPA